ncbi:uncharacterized protein LOC123297489 isoform X2 [Chrysoperla carnea]|uniref:uncharacterized protein LOC123297489 isoform X2 n=1 Tax=Chrysoperla carnea TaxID=189513 RepID=UPI001D083F72|nr:uncharacterized protein LOC123297489 isoform X2 [Chrysoperla carnea]
MRPVSICVFVICLCVVVHGTSSNTVDSETPQWKTDMNRMVLQSNEILTPTQDTRNNEDHNERSHEKNFDRIPPRYRYRNNKRERYYPKPLHKNKHNQKNRQRSNSQPNVLGRLLNPNEYPPNWNGGYYKYHQEGRAVVPHIGANINVPITRGNFRAHRNKIITSVIKPGDEWKYADLLDKRSSETSPIKQSHYRQRDPTYSNDDPRIHKRKHKKHCVMCPEERTLITNKKRDKVLFESPKLRSCLGRPLNSKYSFKSIYGAKPGDLLSPGTHALVGEIHYLNKSLQICHLRVNVITKQCDKFDIPSNLKMDCDAGNNWGSECQFQCENPSHILDGDNGMFCNDDLKWVGNVPNCKKSKN